MTLAVAITKSLRTAWRTVALWFAYLAVDAFEPLAVRVALNATGLAITSDAFIGARVVIVNAAKFDALERSLAAHDPDGAYEFVQGGASAYVPPRYCRMLSREIRHALAAWRAAR